MSSAIYMFDHYPRLSPGLAAVSELLNDRSLDSILYVNPTVYQRPDAGVTCYHFLTYFVCSHTVFVMRVLHFAMQWRRRFSIALPPMSACRFLYPHAFAGQAVGITITLHVVAGSCH